MLEPMELDDAARTRDGCYECAACGRRYRSATIPLKCAVCGAGSSAPRSEPRREAWPTTEKFRLAVERAKGK